MSREKNKNTNRSEFQVDLEKDLGDSEFKQHYDAEMFKLKLGIKIIEMREKSHITQKQLASRIGTTQSVISRIERGSQNCSVETLLNIAKALGVTMEITFSAATSAFS